MNERWKLITKEKTMYEEYEYQGNPPPLKDTVLMLTIAVIGCVILYELVVLVG